MMKQILTVVLVVALSASFAPGDDKSALPDANPQVVRDNALRARAEARLQSAQAGLSAVHDQVRKVEEVLRDKTGRVDVSPDSLRQAASRMENELESLQLDTAGADARMKALAKTVSEVAHKGEDAANTDEVAKQLMIVVAAREQELAMKQKLVEQATISQADLGDARARVAEAKAKLAERRIAVSASAGGGALVDWNREMLNLSLDAQERKARTEFLKQRLDRLRSGLPEIEQLEDLKSAVPDVRARVSDAQRDLEKVHTAEQH
jgi:hypothetical protein